MSKRRNYFPVKSAFPFEDALHINGPSESLYTDWFLQLWKSITILQNLSHTGFTKCKFWIPFSDAKEIF